MSNKQRWITGLVTLIVALGFTTALWAEPLDSVDEDLLKDWDELMHYALLGNWDLAQGYGQSLLDRSPDPIDLLTLAESDRYAHSYRNLTILEGDTPLSDIAQKILLLVEEGRFQRRTDTDMIVREVERLSTTTRGRMLAIERLKDSGEWAVPVMIDVLRDASRHEEVSLIRWALPQLGRPAVNPLLVVLQKSDALNIRVIVLDALGKIGYRSALPYIKEIIDDENAGAELKEAARDAFTRIAKNKIPYVNAAELFYGLAEDYYNQAPSLAVPENQEFANVWFWDNTQGLYKEEVPRGVFDELMTMRHSEDAIRLDASLADAIALWLSSFFRLEAQGFSQPDYFGTAHADAGTYALTAGPEYLHRTLARALDNRNRPVALSAIHALRRNSGQQSLLYAVQGRRPLIEALDYADREIRFSAALTIGGALPQESFEKSPFVVSIIAEALRQQGQRCALIVDSNQQRRNDLVSQLRTSQNYADVVSGNDFAIVLNQARDLPSIDIVVFDTGLGIEQINANLQLMKKDYRLAFCPTVVISDTLSSRVVDQIKKHSPFVEVVLADTTTTELLQTAQNILQRNQARAFAQELGDKYATDAALVLKNLAITGNVVLPPQRALSALLDAIYDNRPAIQQAALQTLARLDSIEAQRAIADFSLDTRIPLETRLLALRCLAISAKRHGQLLLTDHIQGLYAIVASVEQDDQLRNLAAEAYGALNLPSAQVSQLILDQTAD